MLAEPLDERISRGIFQQVNNMVSSHVHQNSVESKVNTFFNTGYPQPESGRRVVRTKHQD
jgi:hypothetical protein